MLCISYDFSLVDFETEEISAGLNDVEPDLARHIADNHLKWIDSTV